MDIVLTRRRIKWIIEVVIVKVEAKVKVIVIVKCVSWKMCKGLQASFSEVTRCIRVRIKRKDWEISQSDYV